MIKKCLAVAAVPMLLAAGANADFIDSISFSDKIDTSATNWENSLSFPQFDSSLGQLINVMFTLKGTVTGSAAYESLDNAAADITLDLEAEISLMHPDMSVLLVAIPVVNIMESADPFDGVINFDGDSGSTFDNLMDMQTEMSTTMDAMDLALFTGNGMIVLPVSAMAMSSASGAGNLVAQFETFAGAEVEVKYTYKVPTPAALSMLAPVGLATLRRRR